MQCRQAPPSVRSTDTDGADIFCGPHQRIRCSGSVQRRKSRSRGAAISRMRTISRSPRRPLGSYSTTIVVSPCSQRCGVGFQPIEMFAPELSVGFQPIVHLPKRLGFEATGPPLRLPALRNQPGLFQHLQMLGDGDQRHVERSRQFRHRGFAGSTVAPGWPGASDRQGRTG